MRFPGERPSHPGARLIALACAGLLAGCGALGAGSTTGGVAGIAALPANGPQADYPVLVGEPYTVAGQTFTPSDTLNYDEVGYLATDAEGSGITGAHHTLPVPSYVEVTSLTTGRTILVRLERRGPMTTTHLLALSPEAMVQLQAGPETPVRVRRVNPPEDQRAMLRSGGSAPLRMDTPMSLVSVLRRNLPAPNARELATLADPAPESGPASAQASDTDGSPASQNAAPPEGTDVSFTEAFADGAQAGSPAQTSLAEPATAPAPQLITNEPAATLAAEAEFTVQAATFSTAERAERAASALGGAVLPSGKYYRVRTGPFVTRAQAEASLAKVRAAGYSDARILSSG